MQACEDIIITIIANRFQVPSIFLKFLKIDAIT